MLNYQRVCTWFESRSSFVHTATVLQVVGLPGKLWRVPLQLTTPGRSGSGKSRENPWVWTYVMVS